MENKRNNYIANCKKKFFLLSFLRVMQVTNYDIKKTHNMLQMQLEK